ncbi:Sec-independent protein translocase subunit TatA [Serinicoccus kebangsaanensis]|uniref:Sec-independent protein translocase subunit TatA n=1 Tax=Serinicoccus kebangsaanensis TaxID=2602069 RepID=UPI00124E816B|nr:Sec-independent protein translocase subunit TatA [Serinicoccus kebangsaanensis]
MRLQAWHIVVLVIAFIVLFGWKNLPNMARSMGESMRVFKSEVDQMKDEGEARKDAKDAERPALEDRSKDADSDTARQEYDAMKRRQSGDGASPNA